MNPLNDRERELVSLGAALASNCVPCLEHHIPQARLAGLTDAQIHEAIELADNVRTVPARKALETALRELGEALPTDASAAVEPSACADIGNRPRSACC